MTNRNTTAQHQLRLALTDLTDSRPITLLTDTGTQTGTLPALLDQATDAITDIREGSDRGIPRSRPPYDLDLADYLNDLHQSARWEAGSRGRTYDDTRSNLHAVVDFETIADDLNTMRLWTFKLEDWAEGLRRRLGMSERRPALSIRDTACPACTATHYRRQETDGTVTVDPALIIPDPTVLSVLCLACGQQWNEQDRLLELGAALRSTA